MDLQKEREALIAEIEVFKAEMLKSYVIKAWADSYVNTDPFSYAIFEDENNKIWWMKAQTHEFWRIWQAAKARAIPDGFVVVPKEPTQKMLNAGHVVMNPIKGSLVQAGTNQKRRDCYKAMIEAAQEQSHEL